MLATAGNTLFNIETRYEVAIYVAGNFGSNHAFKPNEPIPAEQFDILVRGVERDLGKVKLSNGLVLGGTTAVKASGQWLGSFENTAIVSSWVEQSEIEFVIAQVHGIATELKLLTAQDAVAITVKPIHTILL